MNLLAVLLPLLAPSDSFSYSSDELFERGVHERNTAADAQIWFAKAAGRYQAVWKHRKSRNAVLMWGRSSYLAGDNPAAIAAFLTGLQDYPADPQLLGGLRHCRAEAQAHGVTATPSEGIRNRLAPRHRWVWAFAAVSLACFGVWNRFTVRWRLGNAMFTLGIVGLLALAAWEWQCERERMEDRDAPPCVILFETALRTGNGETYPPRLPALLPAGTEVRRIGKRGGWVQVQVLTGEIGWLPGKMVLVIE
jgi:hypothetical protein